MKINIGITCYTVSNTTITRSYIPLFATTGHNRTFNYGHDWPILAILVAPLNSGYARPWGAPYGQRPATQIGSIAHGMDFGPTMYVPLIAIN